MRRLALYVVFKYAGAAGILLAFLWRLEFRSLTDLALLQVTAFIYLFLLHAICPPALRHRRRQPPPGTLVTWQGIVCIVGMFAISLGGTLVFMELGRAGVIAIPLQPETQVISLRLVVGVLLIVSVLSVAEFAMKKAKLDHANEKDA